MNDSELATPDKMMGLRLSGKIHERLQYVVDRNKADTSKTDMESKMAVVVEALEIGLRQIEVGIGGGFLDSQDHSHPRSGIDSFDFEISHEFLSNYGAGTLVGVLVGAGCPLTSGSGVTLVFHQTSMQWKRENGGPETIIMLEHAPMCFAQDLLWLVQQGIILTIREKVVAPLRSV